MGHATCLSSMLMWRQQSELKKREFKGMVRRLKKMGLTVLHIEETTNAEDAEWGEQTRCPYEDFLRVPEEHPDLNAIPSLCGTPFWPKKATLPDPAPRPDLLVMGDFEAPRHLSRMLDEWLVAAALVPLEDPPMTDAMDAAQRLDRDYEMLYGPSS